MKLKENYKVFISDEPKLDLKQAAHYYQEQQNGLGNRFLRSIYDCISLIKTQPKSFQIRYKNTRVGLPKKFPYLIIYDIIENQKEIRIIAILHSSQDPEKWRK